MRLYIGLDLGGTKLMAAAANERGKLLRRTKARTPQSLDDGLALLKRLVAEVRDGEEIAAIGAAIGGPLDWENGVVSPLHQPAWRSVPLKSIMEAAFGCPFYVDVDTNAAALGEFHAWERAPERLLYLTLSTGMGGTLLINGQIYRGAGGLHPEIAHQSIHYRCSFPERITCECGAPDCLEALVSGNGIRRIYGKPAEELGEAAWEEVAYNLGQGMRNLAAVYAPDVIILGGGVAIGSGDWLARRAAAVMREHLQIVPAPQVHLSRLGYDTALHGALALAMRGVNPNQALNDGKT